MKNTPIYLDGVGGASLGVPRFSFLDFDYSPLEFPRRVGTDGKDNWVEVGYLPKLTLVSFEFFDLSGILSGNVFAVACGGSAKGMNPCAC